MRKRDGIILAFVLVLAGVMGAVSLFPKTLETGSWGLSFRQPGQPPIAPVGTEQLKRYDARFLGDTTKKTLYLTFDAGYENGYTEKILDTLKENQVPAAFFLVGNYLDQNEDLVRRMVEEGHIVGNHTLHHYDMSKISDPAVFAGELRGLEEKYKQITGKELPKYYRPPQGIYSEENLKQAKDLGYQTVFWSLAYVDWKTDDQPEAEAAMKKLLPRLHNGAVILLHSTSETNATILDRFLKACKEQGYEFAPLDGLFAQ